MNRMTEIALVAESVERSRRTIAALHRHIGGMTDVAELHEVRARIEAARAWAKVHKQVRAVRLDLLRAEMAALVRLAHLDATADLSSGDRAAAAHLATLTADQREELIAKAAPNVTTASGLVRALQAASEYARQQRVSHLLGIERASAPTVPHLDDAAIDAASRRVADVAAVLKNVIDDYTRDGVSFTVADMADDLIESAGIGGTDDDALMDGVREVCRSAIRRAPVVRVDGTILPRLITVRLDDGSYIRVPIENATVEHLDQMRELRRGQLAEDQAALQRLDDAAARLHRVPGCRPDSRIGDLVAATLVSESIETDSRRSA